MKMRRRRFSWLPLLFLLFAAPASATTIAYELTSLGANSWRADYTVTNDTLAVDIEEFTIWFDLGLFENLSTPLAPVDWDPISIDPDPGLPDDGFYDALALAAGIAPGESLGGFSVEFDYIGLGTPGAQLFDIVDALDPGILLDSGMTVPIPEPGTTLLLGLGLAALAGTRRSGRGVPRRYPKQSGVMGLALLLAASIFGGVVGAASDARAQSYVNLPNDTLEILDMTATSRVRVGRTHFRYTFDVTLRSRLTVESLQVRALAVNSQLTRVENLGTWIDYPSVTAGETITVPDALTVTVDRRFVRFDPSLFIWQARGDGPPVLVLRSNTIELGAPPLGCSARGFVEVENLGVRQGVIDLVDTMGGDGLFDFARRYPFTGTYTRFFVSNTRSTPLDVYYRPLDTVARSATGNYTTNDPALSSFSILATASGTQTEVALETFQQLPESPQRPVDILFTVDRSGSMGDNLTQATEQFDAFIDVLTTTGDDYHVAAVAADDGCVLGADAFIDDSFGVAAAQSAFETMVDVDFALSSYGSNTERGFTLALSALSPANTAVGGCNEGFLRESARLATVHVSDEPEQSAFSWQSFVEDLRALKADPDDVSVHAIAGEYPSGCATASAGSGYFQAVNETGGNLFSICSEDWGPLMANLATTVSAGGLNQFTLATAAVPELVTVRVNGVVVPETDYSISSTFLRFTEIPPPLATIEVEYVPASSCP